MEVKQRKTSELIPYINNARTHSDAQVAQIAASIQEFGFNNPVLIGGKNDIIAGHGRVLAAQKLGLEEVPTIALGHLTAAQKKAYILADNKLAENAGWDIELLKIELEELKDMEIDVDITGFSPEEVDRLFDEGEEPKDLSDEVTETFEIVIELSDESEQEEVYNRLTGEGYTCRVLTL